MPSLCLPNSSHVVLYFDFVIHFRFKWIGTTAVNGVLLVACFIVNAVLMDKYNASPLFFCNGNIQTMMDPK